MSFLRDVNILDLANKVEEVTKRKSAIEFQRSSKALPSASKLEKVVGWKPNVCFEEGLKRTIMWFVPKKRSI